MMPRLVSNGMDLLEISVENVKFDRVMNEYDEQCEIRLNPGDGGVDGSIFKIKEERYS